MDWSKISGLIGAVAPTIATALGGPLADALLYGPQSAGWSPVDAPGSYEYA